MKIISETSNQMVLKDYRVLVFLAGLISLIFGASLIYDLMKMQYFSLDNDVAFFSIIFTIIGIVLLCFAKITTVTINSCTKTLRYSWISIFGRRSREISTADISTLELSMPYSAGRTHYRLVFILHSKEIVDLVGAGDGSWARTSDSANIPERILGEKVANFLKIPFEERQPLTIIGRIVGRK